MEYEKLFCKMEDTNSREYKIKRGLARAGRGFVTFAVFPLVLCAALAGGALTAFDCVAVSGGEAPSAPSALYGRADRKSQLALYEEMCEDVRDYNEEILQRLYEFDKTKVPDGMVGVIPVSLYRQAEPGCVFVSDAGDKKQLDASEYLEKPLSVNFEPSDDYQVLIIHTHGTEAYTPDVQPRGHKNAALRNSH